MKATRFLKIDHHRYDHKFAIQKSYPSIGNLVIAFHQSSFVHTRKGSAKLLIEARSPTLPPNHPILPTKSTKFLPSSMGIFSFFARKAVPVSPSYVKAPSSSSGLSSRSDSTDQSSDHIIDSPVTLENDTIPRSCLKSFMYNTIEQDSMQVEFFPPNDHVVTTLKPTNRVRFAPELEQVNYIENFCNDPCLELWSSSTEYSRRYMADLALARNEKTNQGKKRSVIGEREYLTACNVAYHQFCLTGTVDKCLQKAVLAGIECGYRALERFTSDHQLRRELSQRIRKSTVLLYQSLDHHRAESKLNGTKDNTDVYLRAHIESLNLHHIRWALFMGRLDRLAARHCMRMRTKEDTAMSQPDQTIAAQKRLNKIESIPCDVTFQTTFSGVHNYPERALEVDDVIPELHVFSATLS
jgi:hypothetical protein